MSPLCAWCQLDAPRASPVVDTEGTTTHLLCPACQDEIRHHQGTGILARVEEMRHAALAVDSELRIRAANQAACDLLGAEWVALLGQPLCDVLGCQREHAPVSSDRDAPSSGCAVHCLVVRTFQMGTIGATALPAPAMASSSHPTSAAHLITSLRAGEVVALRIDRLADTA